MLSFWSKAMILGFYGYGWPSHLPEHLIIPFMYFRAGLISLGLLLLSRVLGLARESVQAWAFGTTGVADVVVLMLTLPDLAGAILAGGALSYALLPWWARQAPQALAQSQRRTSRIFFGTGLILAVWVILMPSTLGGWLAPGARDALSSEVVIAMRWAALAVPASLLTLVWYTRLQHERDVVGMYGMNVVHTGVVIVAMLLAASSSEPALIVSLLGAGLLLAFLVRLLFLRWRLGRLMPPPPPPATGAIVEGFPHWHIWVWALLATSLPAALPLLARTLVSGTGEGALATFNYAWKLAELPNQLAIQVVAVLAFPAFARAHAAGREFTVQLRAAFMLSWTLACAAALGLWLAATPLTRLLFGWGRMESAQVAEISQWAALSAWTLLPQALISVLVLVLATAKRLPAAVMAYGVGLLGLTLSGINQGPDMMLALGVTLAAIAIVLMWFARDLAWRALPCRELAVPMLLCGALAASKPVIAGFGLSLMLVISAILAGLLLLVSYFCSPVLRAALKR